jgi:hypothetical protein
VTDQYRYDYGGLTRPPIFWSIVRSHLLYSASSPVPLTKYSILHKGISSQSLGSVKMFTQVTKFEFVKSLRNISCKFLVVHITPARTGELNSHHQQSPMRVEGIHTTGCCPVPRRDRLRHCYHYLSVMQSSARCVTPWLGPRTLLLRDGDAWDWVFEAFFWQINTEISNVGTHLCVHAVWDSNSWLLQLDKK